MVKMDNQNRNKIIGFPILQNQQDFIISKFDIRSIFKFTRYTERILNGFDEEGGPLYNDSIQRQIEISRVEKIADFLIEDPEATFPTNIVLHIPKEMIERQTSYSNFLEITLKQRVFEEVEKKNGHVFITIIDGQHRIKGIEIALSRIKVEIDNLSKTLRLKHNDDLQEKLDNRIQRLNDLNSIELVVSFFVDKPIEYQAMIFSTINRTQKRVSQSLVHDLFGLDTSDTPQKTAIQIIIVLNSHPKSPFYNRIKFYGGDFSEDNSAPLSQGTMAKSIISLISENLRESERDRNRKRKELLLRSNGSTKFLPFRLFYANDQDDRISDLLFYYFSSVRDIFTDSSGISYWTIPPKTNKPQNIFQTTVGYEALLKILTDLIENFEIQIFNETTFNKYLSLCINLKIFDTARYTFNNRGKKILILDMSLAIFPPDYKLNPKDKREAELKTLINPFPI
jgi:DGQHR domain-containing protein